MRVGSDSGFFYHHRIRHRRSAHRRGLIHQSHFGLARAIGIVELVLGMLAALGSLAYQAHDYHRLIHLHLLVLESLAGNGDRLDAVDLFRLQYDTAIERGSKTLLTDLELRALQKGLRRIHHNNGHRRSEYRCITFDTSLRDTEGHQAEHE